MKHKLRELRNSLMSNRVVKNIISKATGCNFNNHKLNKGFHQSFYQAFCSLSAQDGRPLTFCQVGANDGISDDPINALVKLYGNRLLAIEPQPWLLKSLEENYRDFKGNLVIENCACGPVSGHIDLYYLKEQFWELYEENVGRKADQLVSFDSKQIGRRIVDRLKVPPDQIGNYLGVLKMRQKTLSELFEAHSIAKVDVLQIDCEGYDVEVLMGLQHFRPSLINIEYFNLSSSDTERFHRWCEQNAYLSLVFEQDAFAVRTEVSGLGSHR